MEVSIIKDKEYEALRNRMTKMDAIFDQKKPDKYRYFLYREWDQNLKKTTFILLNPSTATEKEDDPTIRRCIEYAYSWGYGSLAVVNLFAFRATDPKVMKKVKYPIGPVNDYYISNNALTVAAWGNHGQHKGRSDEVRKLLTDIQLHCLTVTNEGEPGHPLYLDGKLKPIQYTP